MLFRSRDYSQYSAGQYSAGQYSASEYSASEYSAGQNSASEYSAGLSAPGQLIDAEDCHLLLHNTYPVESQLATTQIKPKIKRNRGVWICEGDGLSVSGGDLQKVYRGWCEWILARGRGLSL